MKVAGVANVRALGRGAWPAHAVYVGRANPAYGLAASKWANPFRVEDHGRDGALSRYAEYVATSPLRHDLPELDGKLLVCWCAPLPCHADVLAAMLELGTRHDRALDAPIDTV